MPKTSFESLPSNARVWVFPADRDLTPDEEARILSAVDAFLEGWDAHGRPLTAGRDWRHGRFLMVGVDEASVPPSGCSIDAMVRVLKGVEEEMGVGFLDHAPVWYREGGEIRRVSRADFKAMARAGEVSLDTSVFDNSVTRKGPMEAGGWEKPAGASWHRRAFFGDA